MTERAADPLVQLRDLWLAWVILFLCVMLFFATWPASDKQVALWFFDQDRGFALAKSQGLEFLRNLFWGTIVLGMLAPIVILALPTQWSILSNVPKRIWAFVITLYFFGPMILVNGVLKAHFGRARPANTEDFGGTAHFTPPFEIANGCSKNCSFVSGEAAGAVTFSVCAWIVSTYFPQSKARRAVRIGLIIFAILASALRVAKGRHYLSDIVFAAIFVFGLAIFLAFLWSLPRRTAS